MVAKKYFWMCTAVGTCTSPFIQLALLLSRAAFKTQWIKFHLRSSLFALRFGFSVVDIRASVFTTWTSVLGINSKLPSSLRWTDHQKKKKGEEPSFILSRCFHTGFSAECFRSVATAHEISLINGLVGLVVFQPSFLPLEYPDRQNHATILASLNLLSVANTVRSTHRRSPWVFSNPKICYNIKVMKIFSSQMSFRAPVRLAIHYLVCV